MRVITTIEPQRMTEVSLSDRDVQLISRALWGDNPKSQPFCNQNIELNNDFDELRERLGLENVEDVE